MLYHLIEWLKEAGIKFPGDALFQFITSRVLLAVILSLVISAVFGKKFINFLRKKQVGETVRDLGLAGEQQKKGTQMITPEVYATGMERICHSTTIAD